MHGKERKEGERERGESNIFPPSFVVVVASAAVD